MKRVIKEIPPGETFVQIASCVISGVTISHRSYGFLSRVLQKPEDWIFHREDLKKIAGSEATLYKVLKELREAGLCTGKMRDEDSDLQNTLRFCAYPGSLKGDNIRPDVQNDTKRRTVKRRPERLDNETEIPEEELI